MLLATDRYAAVLPLIDEDSAHLPLILSVLQGDLSGRVIVDDADHPRAALIVSRLNWVYAVGSEGAAPFRREAMDALRESGGSYFWFGISDDWRTLVRDTLSNEIQDFPRLRFRFCPALYRGNSASARAIPIGAEALERILKKDHADGWFWDSRADFFRKGFGFYLEEEGEIVSVVLSASVTGTEAEIDIHTGERHRGRGCAALLCGAFIEACLERGLSPKWDCYSGNAASIRLAEKLGFVRAGQYPLIAFRLPER